MRLIHLKNIRNQEAQAKKKKKLIFENAIKGIK